PEVEDQATRAQARAAAEQRAQREEAWPKPAAGVLTEEALPSLEEPAQRPIEDDREHLREGDRVLLIIEDDLKFARIMVGMAREKGFKAVVATRGDTGLALANELQPAAIRLDIRLPVVDGWSILDRPKGNARTRHI